MSRKLNGTRLVIARDGRTLRQLAETSVLKSAAVTSQLLSDWSSGISTPSGPRAEALAKVLGVDVKIFSLTAEDIERSIPFLSATEQQAVEITILKSCLSEPMRPDLKTGNLTPARK